MDKIKCTFATPHEHPIPQHSPVHDSAVPLSTHAPLALQAYDVDDPE